MERETLKYNDFEYEIVDGGCAVTGYTGRDVQECVIPYEINKNKVIAIREYAFSGHEELISVRLPEYLIAIGAHAFYNCRRLRSIMLYDNVTDIGDGAFKNCNKADRIELTESVGNMRCLRAVMEELNQELLVTIYYKTGTAVLLFPYYIYEYEENTPGRIINQITIGSGVHYRECISKDGINYAQYDRNFDTERNIDVNESAWKIAYWRLRYPYELSRTAACAYSGYLCEHRLEAAGRMINAEMYDELTIMLDITAKDKEDVEEMIELSRSKGCIKAVGILLEYERKRWGQTRKRYEF